MPERLSDLTLRLFREAVATFRRTYPTVDVDLRLGSADDFPAPRDHAYCETTGPNRARITVAPRFADADTMRQRGLLHHELAHAALMCAGLPHSEAETDRVAELIFGRPIYYDEDDVQTLRATGGRRPRPAYLPTGGDDGR